MTTNMNPPHDNPARSPILRLSRGPAMGWIALIFGGTLIMQAAFSLEFINVLFYTGLIFLFSSLVWHADSLTSKWPWLYLTLQSLLVNGASLLMPSGSPILLAALNPLIISQSYVIFLKKREFYATILLNSLMFTGVTFYISDAHTLGLYFAWFLPMCIVLLGITNLGVNQLQSQFRTQAFLDELEITHKQVEELTFANMQQQMARDLHDTLAQGLAGIVMQLEAIEAYLSKNNIEVVEEIVQQAKGRARRTLAEARETIDNLRTFSKGNIDFMQAVSEEVENYRKSTNLTYHLQMNGLPPLSNILTEHCLHIVRECLVNAIKHSEATQIWIHIEKSEQFLIIEIKDNGEGFDTALIGLGFGHYGLLGIQERVRIIGGTIEIKSSSQGTRVWIQAPITEGV